MPEEKLQTGYAIAFRVKGYLLAQARNNEVPETYIRSVADAFYIASAATELAFHEQNFNRVIEAFKQA